jgi:adenylylsulfate kinase-like enzyme
MTGIDDPYEPPSRPELELNGERMNVADSVAAVLAYLVNSRLVAGTRAA